VVLANVHVVVAEADIGGITAGLLEKDEHLTAALHAVFALEFEHASLVFRGGTSVTKAPVAMKEAQHCFANEPRLTYADNQTAWLEGADALIIVTEWREFRCPNFDTLKAKLKQPVIFDGRNLYDPKLVRGLGFEYLAIGRVDRHVASRLAMTAGRCSHGGPLVFGVADNVMPHGIRATSLAPISWDLRE